jgi:hypothetical protein
MTEETKQTEATPADRASEAIKILEEEFAMKRAEFQKKLVELMNEYGMQFDITTTISSSGRIGHQIDIVPQPQNNKK